MVFSKPIQTMYVGKDIEHSIEDCEYIAYPTQEWILEKAMKNYKKYCGFSLWYIELRFIAIFDFQTYPINLLMRYVLFLS